MTESVDHKKAVLDALMQDYANARSEIGLHIRLYKTQERYGAIIVGVLGVLIPLLISANISGQGLKDLKALGPGAVLVGLFTISVILFHMYFSTLANLFALQVLAERCVLLEEQINKYLEGPVLIWERLTKLIWSKDGFPFHKMPDHMTGAFSFSLMAVFGFGVPLYVLSNLLVFQESPYFKAFAWIYAFGLFAALILAVVQFISMTRVRDECHHMFRRAVQSGEVFHETYWAAAPLPAWTNVKALLSIFSAAAALTGLLYVALKCLVAD